MKTYQSYLKAIVNSSAYREIVEWCNFWIDNARDDKSERILLIGDSNLRNVRHRFADLINMPVDFIGSSSNLEDILFVNQIDTFFKGMTHRYKTVFVQFSHHGVFGLDGGKYSKTDIARYKESYKALIEFIYQFTDKIVLMTIFDSIEIKKKYAAIINRIESRVGTSGRKLLDKYFSYTVGIEHRNRVSRWKNEVIRNLVKEKGLSLIDVHADFAAKNYRYVDMIHYEEAAYTDMAQQMFSQLYT